MKDKIVETLAAAVVIAVLGYAAYLVCRSVWPIVYTDRVAVGATG